MTETNAYGPQNAGDDYVTQAAQHRARGAHHAR